jgi:hypothetical protein
MFWPGRSSGRFKRSLDGPDLNAFMGMLNEKTPAA